MCVGLPARLVEMDLDRAAGFVDVNGERRRVSLAVVVSGGVNPEPGDWLLMSAGIPLERIDPAEARELLDLWGEIDTAQRGER